MNKLNIFAIILLSINISFAQFGPGGGGFGGGHGERSSGDGNGRSRGNQEAQKLPNFDGNAPKGNSKIFGYLVDETVTTAVEYASVALYNKATNKPIDGTMADDKGKFSINKIAPGDYKLVISFIGYKGKTIDSLHLEKGQNLDLGVIKMQAEVTSLNEVTVTGQKSLIEERVDRIVYNAEKDLTARGGDASDVLKKVPLLTVDLDGNVSLRGTSNIKVLINNKPSTIVASSVADALKMIPSDLIKTVEVITSPSAKYDAEGSGGIINIITKKSTLQGITLNVNTGVGIRGSNLGLNGNLRAGKFGMTLGGFGRAFYNKAGTTLDQTTISNSISTITKQSSNNDDFGLFGRYNIGFDYDLAKNQSLTASLAFGTRNFNRAQDFTTNLYSDNILKSTLYRNVDAKDNSNSIDMNLDYIRTFKKPGQEWSISSQISQNKLINNFDADIFLNPLDLLNRQKNINNNFNKELTLQTDYQTPISTNQMFEIGAKTIRRQVDSDFEYQSAGVTGSFATDVRNPKGLLNYTQSVSSGYLSYTYTTKNKYTFKVGTRYEQTNIDANDQKGIIAIPAYGNLVPSVNISKKLSDNYTLKFAYNKRIQRPGLQQLNPNINKANPQNISQGNPNLNPELSDNFEVSLSANVKKTYFNFSLFTRQTSNAIIRLSTPSDSLIGALVTTFQNVGAQRTYGGNLFGNAFLTSQWTLNGGLDLFYNYIEGAAQGVGVSTKLINNSGFVINGRVGSQINLKNGWGLQANAGFRGNQVLLQGYSTNSAMYSLGFIKNFKNKKGSIGLAAENFAGGMKMVNVLDSPNFKQNLVNNIYNQNVKVTFSYKFGKMSFVAPKKTKGVKNDDGIGGSEN